MLADQLRVERAVPITRNLKAYCTRQRYPPIVTSWRRNWERVIPFFVYPLEVRRVLYTTNAIESLNMQLRKITKNRGHFPSD